MKTWTISSRAKLPITDPPKVCVSSFPIVNGNGKLVSASMKKWKKMTLALKKIILEQNFQLPTNTHTPPHLSPPPHTHTDWVSCFLSVDGKRQLVLASMK